MSQLTKVCTKEGLSMVLRIFLFGVITIIAIANPVIGGVINTGFLVSQANHDADLTMRDVPRNLIEGSAEIDLRWVEAVGGELRFSNSFVGTQPEQYRNVIEDPIDSQNGFLRISSDDLPVGTIYCIIDAGDNGHSAIFQIIHTASSAPEMIAPITGDRREGVNTVTPTFRWQPVEGVSFYHLVVSDQPFEITNENDQVKVEGANIVWQAITSETSIMYGVPDPSEFFDSDNIPPLVGHDEDHREDRPRYAWVVLNNYGNHPAYTSSVTGGVSGFEVEVESPFEPAEIIAPEDSADVNADEIIFRWTQIEEASSYFIYVARKEITPGGSEALVPAWNAQTTETAIGCPAGDIFMAGRDNEQDDDDERGNFGQYVWKILAVNQQGRGSMSASSGFQYYVESGFVVFRSFAEGGASLQFVELTSEAVDGAALQPFSTDDDGYHERYVPIGTYQFFGNKIGYAESESEEMEIETDGRYNVSFTMEPLPASIIGSVTDDEGSPIAAATVSGVNQQTDEEISTETNISGEYQIDVEPGRWNVSATADGFEPTEEISIAVEDGADFDMDDEHGPIELIPYTFTISGNVRNPAGQPIQLARVNISNADGTSFSTYTPEAGTYSFTIGPGEWLINATKAGFYLDAGNRPVEIVNRNLEENFTLVPLAGILSGQIFIDGNGANQNADAWFIPDAGEVTITRANQIGGYSQGLSPGDYVVTPVREGHSTDDRLEISIGPGETISGVRLELWANPSSISGRIFDADGESLQGASVSAAGVNTTTDGQGNYTLDVPSGDHVVSASKQGYATEENGPIGVEAGQEIDDVNLTMIDNAGSITGRVRRGQDPIFNATVTAVRGDNEATSVTTTDREGNYSFGLRYGDYRITVEKGGFIARGDGYIDVQLQAGQEVTGRDFAMLNYSARITGTVRSAGGPVSAPSIRVVRLDDENREYNTSGNVQGRFAVTVAPEASYIVIATRDGYSSDQDTTEALDVEGEIAVGLEINALPCQISGRVLVGEDALEQATIRADGDGQSYETQTDGSGIFQLDMEPGEYQLTASKPGHTQAEDEVELNPGQNIRGISFAVEENYSIVSGTVSDPDDAGISNVTLTLIENATGRRVTVSGNRNGAFLFERILPGSYRIETEHQQYADGTVDVGDVVAGQDLQRVSITLEPLDAVIEGRVLVSNQPLSGATIYATVEGNEFTARSNDDGEYIFPNVAQGRYFLLPGRAGFTAEESDSVDVGPGDRVNADLRMTQNDGHISVAVTDPDGAGIRDARVTAYDEQGHFAAAETGPAGTVEMENLYPLSEYTVTVQLAGYAADDDTLTGVESGDEISFQMRPDALELSGSTVNQAGTVIPETAVQATSLADGSVFRTTSNDNGEYQFSGLASNAEYRIQSHRFEETYTNVDRVVETGENHISNENIVIIENSSSISGSVGLREVSIEARSVESGRVVNVYSGADGTYTNLRLRDGSYVLKAERIGYRVNRDSIVVADLGIGENREGVDFQLTEIRVSITGTIIDDSDSPVASAPVLAWSQAGEFRDTTGQDGNFSFEGLYPNQTYSITSEFPEEGYDNGSVDVEVGTNDVANIDIDIVRHNATVTGRVTNSAGDGIGSVIITIDGNLIQRGGPFGNYTLEYLSGGPHSLEFVRTGFVPLTTQINTRNGEGEYVRDVELESLERAIYGVVKSSGFGVRANTNSIVTLTDDLGAVMVDTTDITGIFTFNQLESERVYEITAVKTGHDTISIAGLSVANESVNMDLILNRLTTHVSGSFEDRDGSRIAGAEVILQSFENNIQTANTDYSGEFSIPVVDGSYMLLGVDPNIESLTSYNSNLALENDEGTLVELSLSNAGEIVGELKTEDGEPPVTPGYITSRHEASGIIVFNWSQPNGDFRLRGLRPGNHIVNAAAAGYAMVEGAVTFNVLANTSSELSLTLTQSGKAITGYITESNGDGVLNAQVNITGPSSGELLTNEDGYYTLLGPEAGSYTIAVEKLGYTSPEDTTFDLEAGDIVQIDRELNPTLNAISGTIIDEFGNPIVDLSVLTYFNGTFNDTIYTNQKGQYMLTDLSAGSYQMVPFRDGHISEPENKTVTLEQDSYILGVDFTVSVIRGLGYVYGNISHASGPVNSAVITLENLDLGTSQELISNSNGDFDFQYVTAPFNYRFVATIPGFLSVEDSSFLLQRDQEVNRRFSFSSAEITAVLINYNNAPISNRSISILGENLDYDTTLYTDSNGEAATLDWLEPGIYSVLPQSVGEELPPEPISIELVKDEQVTLTWQMGLTVVPPPPFNFSDSARVEIAIPAGFDVSEGNLFWRGPGDVIFSSKPLSSEGAGLTGRRGVRSIAGSQVHSRNSQDELIYYAYIPPQTRSGTLLFYLEVETSSGIVFGGPNTVQEIQVTNEGMLDHLDLTRTLSGFDGLQLGVPVQFSVTAFDNANNDLSAELGNSAFQWSVNDGGRGTFNVNPDDNTTATYLPNEEGEASLRVRVTQSGITLQSEFEWINQRSLLDVLSIVGPADLKVADNDSTLLTVSAIDTAGSAMAILPIWHIENTDLGSLDAHEYSMNAMFYSNEGMFGRTRIAVVDSLTGEMTYYNEGPTTTAGLGGLQIYGVIKGDSVNASIFTNGQGLIVEVPPGALDIGRSAQISVDRINLPNVMALTPEYEAVEVGYDINIEGSLNPDVIYTVTIPIPEQEGAYTGTEPMIGVWNPVTIDWSVYDGWYNEDTTAIVVEIDQIAGLFSLISASEPLNVSELRFNPNPFSPDHSNGGVSIEFQLSSNLDADVGVTLKIYNMAGEIVRTLIDGQLLPKGSYYRNAPNADRTVVWDGMTDDGNMARNGRYLVTLQARDASGIEESIGTAVLIK